MHWSPNLWACERGFGQLELGAPKGRHVALSSVSAWSGNLPLGAFWIGLFIVHPIPLGNYSHGIVSMVS